MVDWSDLNSAVAGTFCDKSATWGAETLAVALTITPIYDTDTFSVVGEAILADCLADGIEAMKRGDTLTIDSVGYKVMAVHRDGSGWAKITLEKA
jgi:hypothetical protein